MKQTKYKYNKNVINAFSLPRAKKFYKKIRLKKLESIIKKEVGIVLTEL